MKIQKGDVVKVRYKGTLEDGSIFDSTEDDDNPFEFCVGGGNIIAGFENAVMGMEKDEEKEFELEPGDAYGEHISDLVQKVPRSDLPPDELKPGMMLAIKLPNDVQLPAVIKEVDDENVTLDLNHPLAGKALNFKITVEDITREEKEK